jgi:molybdate transport system substrate-binding protein
MKRVIIFAVILFLPIASLFAEGIQESSESVDSVVVFTAASTIDVIQTLADLFEAETGHTVLLNPASSGTLAKQLSQGAEADVYISASKKWMDFVLAEGLVKESKPFAGNRMVLIAPADSPDSELDLTRDFDFPSSFEGRLSMGDPAHVPAGAYAQKALEYYGWYESLSQRILPAANVRAALSVVELAETDRGVVYRTDALKSDKVKILAVFPEESHDPVSYYSALLKDCSDAGRDFYDFVVDGEKTESVLREFGFDMKL